MTTCLSMRNLKFKLYDSFGCVRYSGDSYEEAMEKARLLPSMMAVYVFNENDEPIAAVWSAHNSGIPIIKMDVLIPN